MTHFQARKWQLRKSRLTNKSLVSILIPAYRILPHQIRKNRHPLVDSPPRTRFPAALVEPSLPNNNIARSCTVETWSPQVPGTLNNRSGSPKGLNQTKWTPMESFSTWERCGATSDRWFPNCPRQQLQVEVDQQHIANTEFLNLSSAISKQ